MRDPDDEILYWATVLDDDPCTAKLVIGQVLAAGGDGSLTGRLNEQLREEMP
jgi:hypothetical protein